MGASVSSRTQGGIDKTLGAIDVIIVDTDARSAAVAESAKYPPNIVKDAIFKNIPVVSALWVIQSIVNGTKLPTKDFTI